MCRDQDKHGQPDRHDGETGCLSARRVSGLSILLAGGLMLGSLVLGNHTVRAQESAKANGGHPGASALKAPMAPAGQQLLPINLPTALKLANAQAIDVAIASQRIEVAAAQLQRAQNLWLPTIFLGTDYYRHDGQIQETPGPVFGTSRSSVMVGAGPSAVFAVSDAIFEPLAARQVVRAREAAFQTANNDTMLAVAEAYFSVQQARGELAGAQDAARRAEELVRQVEKLVAGGLTPEVEVTRGRADLAHRRQTVRIAGDRWRVAASDLQRILRLEPTALVEPQEPPQLAVTIVPLDQKVDELVPLALMNRPELAAQQALVQATFERWRQERWRPLVPSVLLRGTSTQVTGTLAGGFYGGGMNSFMGNFGARSDWDLQFLWEFQNLGFSNRARVRERRGEHELSILELFRIEDQVAADVVQSFTLAQSAAGRMKEAEAELREAVDSAEKNLLGVSQTKRLTGNLLILVIRPQEVVAAIQALSLAYGDYYGAIADYNRAQFRLYRALGHPAQTIQLPKN